jgi:hypothetical protein
MNNTIMHRQWTQRPDDERYASLADMLTYLRAETEQSRTIQADTDMLRVIPCGDNDLGIVGKSGNPAVFTHWSMSQVSAAAKAPAAYLKDLSANIAADCLNYGLQHQPRQAHQLYIRQVPANGEPAHLRLRALTSPGYSRIQTTAIVGKLKELQDRWPDWTAPLVYPRGDFGASRVPCVGFAGDRDAYVCLQNTSARITDPADPQGQGLTRGIMLTNSETGARRLDLTLFLCEMICGNFIIWGMKTIATFSMRHYGEKIRREWSRGIGQVFTDYAQLSTRDESAKLQAAAQKQLGPGKPEVIDLLFQKQIATRAQLTDAYDLAEQNNRNPRSAWGIVHGLTRLSQQSPYADERLDLDRAAARVLDF